MFPCCKLLGEWPVPTVLLHTRLLLVQILPSGLQYDIANEGQVAPHELLIRRTVPLDELLGEVQRVAEGGSCLAHFHFFVVRCAHSLVLFGNVPPERPRSDKHLTAVRAFQFFLMNISGHFVQSSVGGRFRRGLLGDLWLRPFLDDQLRRLLGRILSFLGFVLSGVDLLLDVGWATLDLWDYVHWDWMHLC